MAHAVATRLAIPSVHMNGTSRNELMRQLEEAHHAVTQAERTLEQACPNGRNYYVQDDKAIQEALRQHANRLHNLHAVASELMEIYEAIAE